MNAFKETEELLIIYKEEEVSKYNKKYYNKYILKKNELEKNQKSKMYIYLKKTKTIVQEISNFLIIN